MRLFLSRLIAVFVVSAAYFSNVIVANAQVTFEFGAAPSDIKRTLISNRYSDVVIVKESLGVTTVEGCLGGVRYRMKVLFTGQTKWNKKVGKCRSNITVAQARKVLTGKGYDRIDIETRRNSYLAIACLNGERLRVSVSLYGKVRQQRRLGRCRSNKLSPSDVKASLRNQGYTRIRFTDRQLPRYVAQACRGLTRVELTIAGDGDVRQEVEIGRCERLIDPRNLVRIMQRVGFERVKVIDNQLPQYVVEACRGNQKTEVTLNRFGRIIDQYNIGKCRPILNRSELLVMIQNQNLTRPKVISQNNGIYVVKLCDGQIRKHITYNEFGDALEEERKGRCRSFSALEIYRSFANQKYKGLKLYAEGCYRGENVRVELNSLGDSLGSTKLGRC